MANLFLKVPGPLRKRSGSFSEAREIARSLSVERPGTPRPVEMVSLQCFYYFEVDLHMCYSRKLEDTWTRPREVSRNQLAKTATSSDHWIL